MVNTNVSLDYVGPVPAFLYFEDNTIEEYNNYCEQFNNNWFLRDETMKYCKIDCISLY